MPAGAIGACWETDSWLDTAWEEGSWGEEGTLVAAPDVTIRVRPRRTIIDGGLVTKDSSEVLVYWFDYDTDNSLADGVQFTSVGTFTITPTGLTQASQALVTGNRKAQVVLSGGAVGKTYTIEHTASTNEIPAQTKSKVFKLRIT